MLAAAPLKASSFVEQPARGLLPMLVLSVALNYIDRGSLSIAAPMVKDELGISATTLGWLLSAFFWTYALCHLVAGWLVDRFDVHWVLAGGVLLWSAATALTGLAPGFVTLLILRLLLGAGESVSFPSYSKILTASVPEHRRGFANALIDAGSKIGPALGTLFGGFLIARVGWRPFFLVLGAGSLLWLVPWWRYLRRRDRTLEWRTERVPSMMEILRLRSAWSTFAGHFCANYFWYFLLTWLPFYLVRERHFSLQSMAWMAACLYVLSAAVTLATGWLADWFVASGCTPTRVRKTCTVSGLLVSTTIAAVAVVPDHVASMALLLISGVGYGVYASSHWVITQRLAGPAAAGTWSGMQNFVSNLAGVAAAAITGITVDATGQFYWAFIVTAVVLVAGAAVYLVALGPVEPVRWRTEEMR